MVDERKVRDPMVDHVTTLMRSLTHALGDIRVARAEFIRAWEENGEPDIGERSSGCTLGSGSSSWLSVRTGATSATGSGCPRRSTCPTISSEPSRTAGASPSG